jgi:hypothetical protein
MYLHFIASLVSTIILQIKMNDTKKKKTQLIFWHVLLQKKKNLKKVDEGCSCTQNSYGNPKPNQNYWCCFMDSGGPGKRVFWRESSQQFAIFW